MATRKNTGSFVTGGDILNDQIKFFGGSAPSLASISTIRDTLTIFVNSISTLSGVELVDSLNNLFNNTKVVNEAALTVDDYADMIINKDILPIIKT